MKTNWIIRLLLFTVISFSLAVYFAKISGEEKITIYWQNVADKLTDSGNVVRVFTEEEIAAADINEIRIKGVNNDIRIESSKDSLIHFSYYKKNSATKNEMIEAQGPILKIDLTKDEVTRTKLKFNFNFKNNESFGLVEGVNQSSVVIQIPSNIKILKIESVSGEVKLTTERLEEVKIESVSGNLRLQGSFNLLTTSTVSGDIKLLSEVSDPKLELRSTSGDIKVTFKKQPDLILDFQTASGNLKLDRKILSAELEGNVKDLKIGAGSGRLNVVTVSGNLKIENQN